jgi:hypothetical protein
MRELRRETGEQMPSIVKPQKGTPGTLFDVTFEGILYRDVRLGALRTNLRRKKKRCRMEPSEYWMWMNEGLDLRGYSINEELPEEYDASVEALTARLGAHEMTSQEHAMWTEHGVDLGGYSEALHTPPDPLEVP